MNALRSTEGGPKALAPPPSTVKSLKKLLRGVCDPEKTGAFDSDHEEDVNNNDLYLQKESSSPRISSFEIDDISPPIEENIPRASDDNVGTPRRVLFPNYSDGKATKGDSPQSEVTVKMGSVSKKERDGNNLATSPSGNKTLSEQDASREQKSPSISWIRRFLFIAVINCLILGAVLHYFDSVSGGTPMNDLVTRIRKYHDLLLNKASASDGTADVAHKLSDPPKVEQSTETVESAAETLWPDSMYVDAEDTIQQTYDQTQVYLQETVGYLLLDLGEKQNQILEVMYEYQESIQKATSSTTNQLLDITKYYSELEAIQNVTVVLKVFLQRFSGNNTWEQMGIDFSLARWKEDSSSASKYFEPIQKTLELVLAKVNLEHVHNIWLASLMEHIPELNGLDGNIYEKLVEIGDTIVVFYEESGLRQYVGNVEKKLKETIGEENIAIMDEKWAEILDGLSEYYDSNSVKKCLQFETTLIVDEDKTADRSKNSVEGDEEDGESLHDTSEDRISKEMSQEDSPKPEESLTDNEFVDPNSYNVESNVEEEKSVGEELEQPGLNENDVVMESDDNFEINNIEEEEECDGGEEGELNTSDGDETEESEEDANVVDIESSVYEKATEEQVNDLDSDVVEDSEMMIGDKSSLNEPSSEERLDEVQVEDQDTDEDLEMIDIEPSLEKKNAEEIPTEQLQKDTDTNHRGKSRSDEDSEEIIDGESSVDEKATEEIEQEPENSDPNESKELPLAEDDSQEAIEENSSSDGETTNEIPAEEQVEEIDTNESKESAISPEEDLDETLDEKSLSDDETTNSIPIEEQSEDRDFTENENSQDSEVHETDEVLEEDTPSEMPNDEIPGNEITIDETQEHSESGNKDKASETITNDEAMEVEESLIPSQDENPSGALEDPATELIEMSLLDIQAMIREIREIAKLDDTSSSLPPPPSDISELKKGIENILRDANIPRKKDQKKDVDPPELKAQKNWNTSSGWMLRKQRSLEVPVPTTNSDVANEQPVSITESEPKIDIPNY